MSCEDEDHAVQLSKFERAMAAKMKTKHSFQLTHIM